MKRIGILALQGAVNPHQLKFSALGAEVLLVREAAQLSCCHGLVIPGGESTTLSLLLNIFQLLQPIQSFAQRKPIWGVCAGAILMAQHIQNPHNQNSMDNGLGIVPIQIQRNAYGRQNESFITQLDLSLPQQAAQSQEAVFIRAPRIQQAHATCQILAQYQQSPAAITFQHHLLTTFHPELSQHSLLHPFFLSLCQQKQDQ